MRLFYTSSAVRWQAGRELRSVRPNASPARTKSGSEILFAAAPNKSIFLLTFTVLA